MSTKSQASYWFQCLVNRNGICTTRQGTIHADYPYQAMTRVRTMAEEEWGVPLMEVCIYTITKEGEVGTQVLKSGADGGTSHYRTHTCDYPEPWKFGTYKSEERFPTNSLEDSNG